MLELNQRIELEVNSGEHAGTYLSRVEEIGEKDVRVAIPVEKGVLVPIRLKTPVTVTFLGKDAVYSGDTFVIGRMKDPIPVLILIRPNEFRRIQRRDYVRVDTNLPIQIKVINEQDVEKNQLDEKTVLAHTRNISGGGMMAAVEIDELGDTGIPLGTLLDIKLNLPDVPVSLLSVGKVVRVEKHRSPKDTNELVLGICFVSLEEKTREHIISYVFRRQRELRKLGLL